LSVGSDPTQVQDDFEKLFDAISMVEFDEQDPKMINAIMTIMGENKEDV